MQFDVIPFEDIKGDWKKLGSGSFGNVYKGTYLGIDVAIKEVLPSNDYDVRKYFEREWKLMREARHPNVVLFLGLSNAPYPDGRVFIVSEYIENGNLRQYLFAKSKPFPWRLRISFCIDIARALAYLHARNCVHRDIKGENLLLTSNGRLKITDFGFARITPRNEDEAKRLTFCGTDAYMSPEILMGDPFDLPTDVFSLGIIFCEILARRLADDHAFKRAAPTFSLDPAEVQRLASPGCPPELISLALDCCSIQPSSRPSMVEVLSRLTTIEQQVELAARAEPDNDEQHAVGTVKFFTATGGGADVKSGKRPRTAPRIPSFGLGVGTVFDVKIPGGGESAANGSSAEGGQEGEEESSEEDAIKEVGAAEVVVGGANVKRTPSWAQYVPASSSFIGDNWSIAGRIPSEADSTRHLLSSDSMSTGSHYSTTVVRGMNVPTMPDEDEEDNAHANTSTLTIRAARRTFRSDIGTVGTLLQNGASSPRQTMSAGIFAPTSQPPPEGPASEISIASYHTAPSIALATEGSTSAISTLSSNIPVHRFTLIKTGSKRPVSPAAGGSRGESESGWSPFGFFFTNALGAKCDLCAKRLGWKAALECDDCGMRAHVKCGEKAPRDCGLRFPKVMPAVPASAPLPRKKSPTGKANGLYSHR